MRKLCLFSIALLGCAILFSYEQTAPRRIAVGEKRDLLLWDASRNNINIVLVPQAYDVARFSAAELQKFLSASSGRPIPLTAAPVNGKVNIFVGSGEYSKRTGIDIAAMPRDGFVIRRDAANIIIAGRDNPRTNVEAAANMLSIWSNNFERGTLNGVYDFLERFVGVRFYFPGELGTIVPRHAKLALPEMDIADRPDYTVRLYTWYKGDFFDPAAQWGKDGVRAKTITMYRNRAETQYLPCNHGLLALNYHGRFAKTHPEYFAVLDGRKALGKHPYLCFSSNIKEEIFQDAKAFFSGKSMRDRNAVNQYGYDHWDPSACQSGYFNIMPQDGFRLCECPECRRIKNTNPQPGVPDKEISDHIWRMTADIASRLKKENIPGTITQMAYWPYNRVPNFELPDNILVMVGMPGPWNKNDRGDLLTQWVKKINRKLWIWTYAGKFGMRALPGFPSSTPWAVGHFYQEKRREIFGAYMESDTDRFLFHYLNYYVFGKVSWDNSIDVDKLLDEHFRLMYGRAAEDMKAIFKQIETDWIHKLSGELIENEHGIFNQFPSEYKIWHNIYPRHKLRAMAAAYDDAEKKAETLLMKKRVRLMKEEFLGGIIKQADAYFNRIRMAEEWQLRLPRDGSSRTIFLRRTDESGLETQYSFRCRWQKDGVTLDSTGQFPPDIKVLCDGKQYDFTGEQLLLPLKKSSFDIVRLQKGRAIARWNFFLDAENFNPASFGSLAPGDDDSANIVVNGDFSGDGAPGWLGPMYAKKEFGVHIDNQEFLTAGQAMRLESNGRYSCNLWQELPKLKPSTAYRITFFIKLDDVKPYGADGGIISSCFDQVNRWYPAGPLTGTMPWTKQALEIVTGPETNKKYKSYFSVMLRNCSGRAWVDNIRISEIKNKVE